MLMTTLFRRAAPFDLGAGGRIEGRRFRQDTMLASVGNRGVSSNGMPLPR